MISVEDALAKLFGLLTPLETELIPLRQASGRVLTRAVSAGRDQPPFAASAMDGYALHGAGVVAGASFEVVGEAAAGHRWNGTVTAGQAVRIFTGAPVPNGADRVIIQEDTTRSGSVVRLKNAVDLAANIRPAGGDFSAGETVQAPRLLGPHDVALLAAMNVAEVPVARKPQVAIIATGDELVMPGEVPKDDQIIASNTFGLAALVEAHGAEAHMVPIARDTVASLEAAFGLAKAADLIVTVGGASEGDHDIVGAVAEGLGMERAFYKIAMRPGKPLMAGRLGGSVMVGLPGNPVSAMVCGHVVILPMLRALQGLGAIAAPQEMATLGVDLPVNGPGAHYMRARMRDRIVTPASSQDSALLGVLAHAHVLLIRPANEPARHAGEQVSIMRL